MLRKLKSKKGETLVETIAAILVVSLASAAFAAMVMSASKINATAAEVDNAYYEALIKAENNGGGENGTVTAGGSKIKVTWTKTDKLCAYRSTRGGGAP